MVMNIDFLHFLKQCSLEFTYFLIYYKYLFLSQYLMVIFALSQALTKESISAHTK